jgi:hypothetical protein
MTTETRSTTVTFRAPFTLPGLGRTYPPGNYRVNIDEEQLDVSFPARRHVATVIMLVSGAMTQAWPVNPRDLETVLAHDAVKTRAWGWLD